MAALRALVVVSIVVAAAGLALFHDDVFFLQGYDGTVVRSWYQMLSDASRENTLTHTPMLELDTGRGRLEVAVPQDVYNRVRPGVRVTKRRFSNRVVVSP